MLITRGTFEMNWPCAIGTYVCISITSDINVHEASMTSVFWLISGFNAARDRPAVSRVAIALHFLAKASEIRRGSCTAEELH